MFKKCYIYTYFTNILEEFIMLKKICLLFLLTASFAYAGIFDSLDANSKKFIMDSISFQEKLKNCTPSEFSASGTYMKIYGLTNGLCHYVAKSSSSSLLTDTKTGKTINISNCNYNIPLAELRRYANYNIKLTKAMYQIDNTTISKSEMNSISDAMWDTVNKYCK